MLMKSQHLPIRAPFLRSFACFFALLCMFPFIGPNIGTDAQPFALLISVVLFIPVVVSRSKIKVNYTFLFCFLIFCVFFFTDTLISLFVVNFYSFCRRSASYVSILLIPFVTYYVLKIIGTDGLEKIVKSSILVWFFVGAVQTFFHRNFLNFLIPFHRTTVNRGVISLASEPAYYAYMCFFFALFAIDFQDNSILYTLLSLSQIILFAKSFTGLSYIVVLCVLKFVFSRIKIRNRLIIIALVSIILSVSLFFLLRSDMVNKYRFSRLLSDLLNNHSAFSSDPSFVDRFSSITDGFSRWGVPYVIGNHTRNSGFGTFLYEFGIFSLFYIIPMMIIVYRGGKNGRDAAGALALLICMLSSIQLSTPIFSFFIGYRYYRMIFFRNRLKKTATEDIYIFSPT